MTGFSNEEFSTRNFGFVTEAEQVQLRHSWVFVCGAGGMGGSAIMNLIRAGVGKMILADLDAFEVSNLNRQVVATLDGVDHHKANATRDACQRINPQAEIDVFEADWSDHAERPIGTSDVVINGTDDLGASLLLIAQRENWDAA